MRALVPLAALLGLLPSALANGGGHGHADGEPLFDSGDVAVGATFTLETWEEGPLAYHCHPHPWMEGAVLVEPAEGLARTLHVNITDAAGYQSYAFTPATLYARVGDFVVWHNNGSMPHTVTSDEAAASPSRDGGAKDSPTPGVLAALVLLAPLAMRRRSR